MNENTKLIIAAVAATVVGLASTTLVIAWWPPEVTALIVMGPFCLIWGVGMLCYALTTRKYFKRTTP